jgi:hypothetical protein
MKLLTIWYRVNVKLGGINSYPVNHIYHGLCKEATMIVGEYLVHNLSGIY